MSDPLPSTSMVPMGAGVTSVELPSRFTVSKGPGTYELSWRWRDQVPLRNFIGIFLVLAAFQLPRMFHMDRAALALLALYAGLGAFGALAWAKNRVTMRLDHDVVTVRHAPIPAVGRSVELGPDDVIMAVGRPGTAPRWAVAVDTRGRRRRRRLLVGSVLTREQAELIVDELNAARVASKSR